jgi:hypothetical protein
MNKPKEPPEIVKWFEADWLPRSPEQGRPRLEDKDKSFEATKPWLALGMSRRTWYSRRKEKATLHIGDKITGDHGYEGTIVSVYPSRRRKEKGLGK